MRKNSINMDKKINEKVRKQKGITLIVTIVVMLILAGVSVVMLTGENGLLKKATTAFEINNKLQIASINGTKVADNSNSSQDSTELLNKISTLESTAVSLQSQINSLKSKDENLQTEDINIQTRLQAIENAAPTSFKVVNFTTPGTVNVWTKVASYPTDYTRDNCIINTGYFYSNDTHQKVILPFSGYGDAYVLLEMRTDGIYGVTSASNHLNKSGKLYLQKIN